MLLTVSIPTFNRAIELERCLHLIVKEIKKFKLQDKVAIYVADNFSNDHTITVLKKAKEKASNAGISFEFMIQSENFGPDINTIDVYNYPKSKYIWWFSDDDLIEDGQLIQLIEDLEIYQPTICISNFRQPPFNESNPGFLASEVGFYGLSDNAIKLLVKRAKLTSYVVKKGFYSHEIKLDGTFWGFLGLSLSRYLEEPSLLIRSQFIARCDSNYLNIRYHPNVNFLCYKLIQTTFNHYEMSEKIKLINEPDPFFQTLNFLELHYRGLAILEKDILVEIKKDIKEAYSLINKFKYYRFLYFKKIVRILIARMAFLFNIKY